MNTVASLPNNGVPAWIRFALRDPTIQVREYAKGYGLLTGAHGGEWMQRGFDAVLQAVRNGVYS